MSDTRVPAVYSRAKHAAMRVPEENARTQMSASRAQVRESKRRENRRIKRMKQMRSVFMFMLVLLVAGWLFVGGTKMAKYISVRRNIVSIAAENRLLEAREDNLASELKLETRSDIIRQTAQSELGMIMPTSAKTFVMAGSAQSSSQTANLP